MRVDKLRCYVIQIALVISLILAIWIPILRNRYVLSIILFMSMIFCLLFIRKRKIYKNRSDEIIKIIILFGLIYILAFYALGIYFGYYKNPYKFSIQVLIKYIIPIGISIISSEVIRKYFLLQKFKYTNILTFVSMVFVDIYIYSNMYDLFTLEGFLKLLGFVSFSSIACNLFYNYIANRYGILGNIVFKLITILYLYILPVVPNVYIFFRSFLRIIYPFLMYLIIEFYTDKDRQVYKNNKSSLGFVICTMCLLIIFIGMISCKYKYGALVVGSGSMSGTIDKGDAIVFESIKDKSKIEIGDIIVFNYDDIKVVHRVTNIVYEEGEYHYYTQGDMNDTVDRNYRTENDILGIYKFRIQFIGYPTLWINDIFSK